MSSTHEDVEMGKSSMPGGASRSAMLEAAALLTLWSLLVINEGSIRLIESNPAVDLLEGGRPPKLVPFLGGLFEVAFGLFGFLVGVTAFLLKRHSVTVTKVCLAVQTVLGYYVFIVFVFMIPSFRAADLPVPSLVGLSLSQSRFIIALGILTSFHFCLALQGGQFVFMARLVCGATGENFLSQRTGNRMRAIFWNSNLAFSGLWTLLTGAIISGNVGSGKLEMEYSSPPNVGVLPLMTVATGLLMLLWGIVGVAMAVMRIAPMFFFAGSAVLYVLALLNFGIVQFGQLDGPPGGPVALHNGLVFMVVFIGAYFVYVSANENEKTVE